jgi:hypothetical protein
MSRETKGSHSSSDVWRDLTRSGPRPSATGNRSPWRGSGRGYGESSWRQPAPTTQEQPLGNLITSIDISDLSRVETQLKIRDCEYVASYNWVDSKAATIIVPGQ